MKSFATLINALDSTNKTTLKVTAIHQFLNEAVDEDKLWFLALFTGKRPKRPIPTAMLRQWAMEIAAIPEWLFVESHLAVGDLAETIALILPERTHEIDITLSEWMRLIAHLKDASEQEKKEFVLYAWSGLSLTERFIFNKLLGGSFRVGVSSKILISALAAHYELDPTAVAHSIMGEWSIEHTAFEELVKGGYANTSLSKPYPFCLAYGIEGDVTELGAIQEWQAEYKWDGIRGQVIKRKGEVFVWSRGEELVTDQFPELVEEVSSWSADNFVLDGEIVAFKEDKILNFTALQKRVNRKTLSKKMLQEVPVIFIVYDLLEWDGEDKRSATLTERRRQLEQLLATNAPNSSSGIRISPALTYVSWEELKVLRAEATTINSEGLMLKKKEAAYETGRKKGIWWKWKVDPMTIDAVLIYAQKGSGRRSAFYTDYTFAVKDGDKLVTIAKAYSGLTNQEIQEVNRFVTKNAIEKFGPVRTVKPELVFEIAFEGIGFSARHKSGVALRFPRILRWRKDKTVAEIDDIEEVKKLIRNPLEE